MADGENAEPELAAASGDSVSPAGAGRRQNRKAESETVKPEPSVHKMSAR
jgi:hypothetical protein